MKKKDVLKILKDNHDGVHSIVSDLKRNSIYTLDDHYHPVQTVRLTHFYRTGLRFKPLTSRSAYLSVFPFTLKWSKIRHYEITEVPMSHLLKCVNMSTTEYYTEVLSKGSHKPGTDKSARSTSKALRKLLKLVRPKKETGYATRI